MQFFVKVCAEESVEMSVMRCVAYESNGSGQEKILLCNIRKKNSRIVRKKCESILTVQNTSVKEVSPGHLP